MCKIIPQKCVLFQITFLKLIHKERTTSDFPHTAVLLFTAHNRYLGLNCNQPLHVSNLFLCISMEIFLTFFACFFVEMQSCYAIIALIQVFSVVNIRRGPQNG